MTSNNAPFTFYPQYCFKLSQTANIWCHLRAADIANKLTTQSGFGGQDVWFYNNHPVKWVRATGMIVGISDFEGKRVYTIDDGSGVTLECAKKVPRNAGISAAGDPKSLGSAALPSQSTGPADLGVDYGDIVDIKGIVKIYPKHGCETRQLYAEKIVPLHSTEQEVQFWEKLNKLRIDILDKPWVLDERTVRKCRKQEEGHDDSRRKEKRERRERERSAAATASGIENVELERKHSAPALPVVHRARITGLEKKVKPTRRAEPGKA
ncbi:hypothetical protein OQA88_10120 [Cercophora sp. LCS_1]